MKRKLALIVASILLSIAGVSGVWAQKAGGGFTDWGPLTHLPPPINTPYDDQAAVLSRDGRTIFFSSNRPGSIGGSRDIWFSTRAKGLGWGKPRNLGPVINSSGTELVRSITADGRVLLFQSDRGGGNGQADIWVITRESGSSAWGEPINLGAVINTPHAELASNYLFAEAGLVQKLFYSSNKPGGFGGPDIYVSTINESGFESSVNVFELNTPSVETCFWVSDDGKEIIFSSNRPNLTEDRNFDDLWTATRDSVFGSWSAPVRLGPQINTPGFRDLAPFVTREGTTMLVSSNRPGGLAEGTFDIYMTRRERRE